MKDFDQERQAKRETAEERDRSFTIGGERFRHRDDVPFVVFAEFVEDDSVAETLSLRRFIEGCLDPADNAVERWHALLNRKTDPLTVEHVAELVNWLLREVGGHPTRPSSPSPSSQNGTGETSTDGSSSPPAEVSAP